jgi:hypothetical protein
VCHVTETQRNPWKKRIHGNVKIKWIETAVAKPALNPVRFV